LDNNQTHRYGPNSFKLHKLPIPKRGKVLGLVGSNGLGKSTIIKILANRLIPNFGNFTNESTQNDIITYYRGSELQSYFTKLYNNEMKAIIKPQYVDIIPKNITGNVEELLRGNINKDKSINEDKLQSIIIQLDLTHLLNRNIAVLSGGELQRFAIAMVILKDVDIYMFDEPSSYLDIKQRLKSANLIRSLANEDKYVVCIEHDLSILDYLSDNISCLYGIPNVYGVVTVPFSSKEGINIFLSGFIPTENLRFRDEALDFNLSYMPEIIEDNNKIKTSYPDVSKILSDDKNTFKLNIEAGSFSSGEIIVLLGENGLGKTLFMKILAGIIKTDEELPKLNVSYKPQMISPKFMGSVRELLYKKIGNMMFNPQFISDVLKPLNIESLYDSNVQNLSGGELQRCAIILCLGKPTDIYIIDEPSAYLDSEQRIIISKVIKKFILHANKTAFIVEHDFMMATYLADKIIVYEGQPGIEAIARSPQSCITGMNSFLKILEVTFRKENINGRSRINKLNSVLDREQKLEGKYFYTD
jgi:ATP-binding cassette subfamily E protein 1